MIKKNLVSILILNYNNQQYLDKAIKSCLNQTHKNIEIVIYDDKSNDNSKLKILKFKKNKKIKIFFNNDKKKNIAAFDAANGYERAFKKSRGEIICFLDSDDIFKKDKVEKIVNFFSKNKDCMLVQNMPMEFYGQDHQKKMNKNSYFSYWPYLAPESCISIKKHNYPKNNCGCSTFYTSFSHKIPSYVSYIISYICIYRILRLERKHYFTDIFTL